MCVHSNGSVVVTFDLQFSQLINVEEAEQQLEVGLQEVEATGFVIDKKSIQITGDSQRPQLSSVKTQRPNRKHFTSGTNCDSLPAEKQDETTTAPMTSAPPTGETAHISVVMETKQHRANVKLFRESQGLRSMSPRTLSPQVHEPQVLRATDP